MITFVTLLDDSGANDSTSPGEERITAATTSAADDIITLFIVCRQYSVDAALKASWLREDFSLLLTRGVVIRTPILFLTV